MKKLLVATCLMASFMASAQLNLGSILGGASNSSSSLSDLVNTVSSVVGNNDVDLANIIGTWKYHSPAVTFNSDNLLQKAGGAAASATIENKLKTYYSKAGLTSLVFTFDKDGAFTLTAGKMKSSGTVVKNEDGSFSFSFSAFGKIPAGNLKGYIQRKGSDITITFDASKLIDIIAKVASLSGNSTLKSASSLLNSYDGMNIGCELTKG